MYDHVDDHDVGLSASLLVPEVPEVLDSCHAKVGTEAPTTKQASPAGWHYVVSWQIKTQNFNMTHAGDALAEHHIWGSWNGCECAFTLMPLRVCSHTETGISR